MYSQINKIKKNIERHILIIENKLTSLLKRDSIALITLFTMKLYKKIIRIKI